jgi:hypothetical protein
MGKYIALFGLLRKGAEVADVEKWKARQITANILGGVIVALVAVLKGFGYELPMDDEAAYSIAGGVIATVNVVLTAVTSKRAGLLPAAADNESGPVFTTGEQDLS